MYVVVIGAGGLLGSTLVKSWGESGDTVVPLDLPEFDVASRMFVLDAIVPLEPDVIVNASGIGMIDWLETRPNTARTVHIHGAANLREAANRTGALFVQLSCGEVFSQKNDQPHTESETPEPASVFARTKLDAERACSECERHLIVRTGMLFGAEGKRSCANQIETILNALRKIRNFKVLNDILLSPSWTYDVSMAIRSLVERKESGLWHIANSGISTHFELAGELRTLTGIKFELEPISSEEYEFKAPRSNCPALDCSRYSNLENVYPLREWREALKAFIESRSRIY